jgi:DNA-binding GntR family transcriptional regulator
LESHEELLNAVTNRDTEIASAEMRKHLSNSLGRNDHHFH